MMKEEIGMKNLKSGNNIEIIDNFLDKEDFNKLQELLLGAWFPWYFCNGIVGGKTEDPLDMQFVHTFVRDQQITSDWFVNHLGPIIKKINPEKFIKVKSNLQPATHKNLESHFHIDIDEKIKAKTSILYINTNNGYTLFEDGTRIDSIENRFVTFDSNILHKGVTCTDQKTRCVINFNYT